MQTKSSLKIWLLCVNFAKFTFINVVSDQSQPSKTLSGDWFKVTAHQTKKCKELVCIHDQLCKISAQIIDCKMLFSCEFSITL